jgi:hypothetical protein
VSASDGDFGYRVAAVLRTERIATSDSRSGQGADHGQKYMGIFLGSVDYGLQPARLSLWSYCDPVFRVRDMRGSRPTGRELFFCPQSACWELTQLACAAGQMDRSTIT